MNIFSQKFPAKLSFYVKFLVPQRNTIPGDSPANPSGVRLGSAFMTSRGWKEKQFYKVGTKIGKLLTKVEK